MKILRSVKIDPEVMDQLNVHCSNVSKLVNKLLRKYFDLPDIVPKTDSKPQNKGIN